MMNKSTAALLLATFAATPAFAAGDGLFDIDVSAGRSSPDAYNLGTATGAAHFGLAGYQVMSYFDIEVPYNNAVDQDDIDQDWGTHVNYDMYPVPDRSSGNAAASLSATDVAYKLPPNGWSARSRGAPTFSLKIPYRYLRTAI